MIHAWKKFNRTNYCTEERKYVTGNLDLYHNLVKFCSQNIWLVILGLPMDCALVNAGSHDPPSNVFYMVLRPQVTKIRPLHVMEPSATLALVTPSHDGLAMHAILFKSYFFVIPYLLGRNFWKTRRMPPLWRNFRNWKGPSQSRGTIAFIMCHIPTLEKQQNDFRKPIHT